MSNLTNYTEKATTAKTVDFEKELTELYKCIVKIDNLDDCKNLFEDLCTRKELSSFAERFVVAKLIAKGITYREISNMTGASTATVTRVAQWLNYGKGGYKSVINDND